MSFNAVKYSDYWGVRGAVRSRLRSKARMSDPETGRGRGAVPRGTSTVPVDEDRGEDEEEVLAAAPTAHISRKCWERAPQRRREKI